MRQNPAERLINIFLCGASPLKEDFELLWLDKKSGSFWAAARWRSYVKVRAPNQY
jgi:hypothetical protein